MTVLRAFADLGSVTVQVESLADEANNDLYRRGYLTRDFVGRRNDEVTLAISDAGQAAIDALACSVCGDSCEPNDDERACCEFTHLWAGTHADNQADMARKRRGRASRRRLPPGVQPNGSGYQARVQLGRRRQHLGTFRTIPEALAAIDAALGRG